MQQPLPPTIAKFQQKHKKVWDAFDKLGQTCHEEGPLDEKTRRLVKLALSIALRHKGAVHSATRNAQLALPAMAAGGGAGSAAATGAAALPGADTPDQLKQELENLKKQVAALAERLKAQEKQNQQQPQSLPAAELVSQVKELDQRVSQTERSQALDRISFTGDYRFEAHTIRGKVPAHFDGMKLQNLVVKTMFATPILGRPPAGVTEINNTVSGHYADYLQFTNNLTFAGLQKGMASFPAAMQQQLFGMLMPSTFTPAYSDNTDALFTNRLRLKFAAKVADNISFTGRLTLHKSF